MHSTANHIRTSGAFAALQSTDAPGARIAEVADIASERLPCSDGADRDENEEQYVLEGRKSSSIPRSG